MKLLKTSAVTFGAGGAVILAATLGISYMRQGQEQQDVKQQLDVMNTRISALPPPQTTDKLVAEQKDLNAATASLQQEYDRTVAGLAVPIDSIQITDTIKGIAGNIGVRLAGMRSSGVTGEQLKGVTFSSISVETTVEGQVRDLVRFVSGVTAAFPTAVVKTSDIQVPQPDPAGGNVQSPFITLQVSIYSFEGN